MNPLISIIVPIYKVEKYIDSCINSILCQKFRDYEVLLIDDGSPDNCLSICNRYAKIDTRIKVVHKANGGLVSARKAGLKECRGKYIMNIDGDDYIAPDLLENLSIIMKTIEPDILSFDYELVDERGEKICEHHDDIDEGLYGRKKIDEILQKAIYDRSSKDHNTGCFTYNIWSKAIKKELLESYQFTVPNKIRMGEDLAVVIPTIENAQTMYISKMVGYRYRQRENSMVRTFNYSETENIYELLEYLHIYLKIVPEENIIAYGVRMLLGQLIKAARTMDSFSTFKVYAGEVLDKSFETYLQEFEQENLMFRRKIRLWIIKKKLWRIFWNIYSKKGQK